MGLGVLVPAPEPVTVTSVPEGVTWWQFRFDQNTGITLPDYNVTMPQAETLQN